MQLRINTEPLYKSRNSQVKKKVVIKLNIYLIYFQMREYPYKKNHICIRVLLIFECFKKKKIFFAQKKKRRKIQIKFFLQQTLLRTNHITMSTYQHKGAI